MYALYVLRTEVQVLVLVMHLQLNQVNDAIAALNQCVSRSPKVADYLLAARKKKPPLNDFGISVGGDDEAWIYRDAMRDIWKSTPGAFKLLKHAVENPVAY